MKSDITDSFPEFHMNWCQDINLLQYFILSSVACVKFLGKQVLISPV